MSDRNDGRQLAVTLLLLIIVNVAAIVTAPLVERFALHHGEPGWQGRAYPVMTAGLIVAVSLFIVHERVSGRPAPWWAWLALGVTVAFTGWVVVMQEVVR